MNIINPLSTTLERWLLVSSFSIYFNPQFLNYLQSEDPAGRPIAIALDTVSLFTSFKKKNTQTR